MSIVKIILYAPTWRESSDNGNSRSFIPPINIDFWREKLSDDFVLLFRMHHLTTKAMEIKFDSFVRDYSGPYDVNELIKISDILITDYSSILSDFSILEKPILLFAYDYEEYCQKRGLYKRLEELLPGCIYKTEEELIHNILNMNFEENIEIVRKYKQRYVYEKNDSTSICIKALKDKISNKI